MAQEAIAANLRRLRKAHELTQAQLAGAAGLSLAAYRNLETRKSVPRVDTLQSLAGALDVPIQELVTPVPEFRAVRFRSFKRLKTREQILADVARWLSDFNDLEEILADREEYRLKGFKWSGRRENRPIGAARWARKLFGLDGGEPVRDICGLLEANGIKVRPVRVASDAFFGLSVGPADGGPAIVVNTWERISVERWIFTAAHELGHLVLHSQDYDIDEREEGRDSEREANLFAAHFLMPEEAFAREWEDACGLAFVDRVFKVKRIFRVSYRTVLYRLSEGLADKAELWRRFQVDFKRRSGKTLLKEDEPEALAADAFRASLPESSPAGEPEKLSQADFLEDRLSRLVRKAVEKSAITLSRGAEVLGLSLQEMRELSASWVG